MLLAAPIFVSLQLLLGIFTASLWLTWTCAQLNRPLLGISTYALVWYLESFSDVPPELDLRGGARKLQERLINRLALLFSPS